MVGGVGGMLVVLLVIHAVATVAADGITLDVAPDGGVKGPPPNTTVWTDAQTLGIRGLGWPVSDLTSPYTR